MEGEKDEHGQQSAIEVFKQFHGKMLNTPWWLDIFCALIGYLKYLQNEGRIDEVQGLPGSFKFAD